MTHISTNTLLNKENELKKIKIRKGFFSSANMLVYGRYISCCDLA